MSKIRVYGLGMITLLMLPLSWGIIWFFDSKQSLTDFLRLDEVFTLPVLGGLAYGIAFGLLMLWATNTEEARKSFRRQLQIIRSFRLTVLDCLFLSLCAGIGEEFLFRITLQEWIHPLLNSVIFVAIHGYFDPRDWSVTKYGLLILVFIIGLGYGVGMYGIWACVVAHAAYDFVLFYAWSRQRS